ncbi:hypothetical protein D7Y27_20635, partial [Corallococcus sp. AB004]
MGAWRELRRRWRRVPLLQQFTAADCGPTCLAMVLAYHGAHSAAASDSVPTCTSTVFGVPGASPPADEMSCARTST